MVQREPPLRDDELKVLRGIMEEYLYETERRRRMGRFFGDARSNLVAAAAIGVFLLDTIAHFIG